MASFDYDVVIIGSGFGGNVAALRAAEKGYRVGVMEAGKRWSDADIPRTNWDLKGYLWFPAAELYGMQRIEYLDDVLVLCGAGVGGGAHVYGNTLYVPPRRFFDAPGWAGITDWADELAPCYDQARRSALLAARALAALAFASFAACGRAPAPQPAPPAVTVAHPLAKNITDWDEYTGRIEAVEAVEVRARVSGYLQSVHFDEGSMVDEGELLYVIDPRPYRAVLEEATAELTRAKVRLELAGNDRDRADRLLRSRAISEEEADARTQRQREAVAALEAAEAAVRAATLDVEFTEVRAPIGGRIGRLHVTRGNLVSGGTVGSTLLTTIVSVDPVYVYFTGDEREYLKYSPLNLEGTRPSSRDFANPVRIRLADETEFSREGRMNFVANTLDEASGTIQGRALFANPDGLLTPGMFVALQLLGRGPYESLLLPDEAIGADQSQRFVYVVGDGNVVERRPVEVGRIEGRFRIIKAGLTAADRIVVNGLPRVRPGATVNPQLTDLGADASGGDTSGQGTPSASAAP